MGTPGPLRPAFFPNFIPAFIPAGGDIWVQTDKTIQFFNQLLIYLRFVNFRIPPGALQRIIAGIDIVIGGLKQLLILLLVVFGEPLRQFQVLPLQPAIVGQAKPAGLPKGPDKLFIIDIRPQDRNYLPLLFQQVVAGRACPAALYRFPVQLVAQYLPVQQHYRQGVVQPLQVAGVVAAEAPAQVELAPKVAVIHLLVQQRVEVLGLVSAQGVADRTAPLTAGID